MSLTLLNYIDIYSSLPMSFIERVAKIMYADEDYTKRTLIDFDVVVRLLGEDRQNLKKILVRKCLEDVDYVITYGPASTSISNGGCKETITLIYDTFVLLCMMSGTKKAKDVREYFFVLDKLQTKYGMHTTSSSPKKTTARSVARTKPKTRSRSKAKSKSKSRARPKSTTRNPRARSRSRSSLKQKKGNKRCVSYKKSKHVRRNLSKSSRNNRGSK